MNDELEMIQKYDSTTEKRLLPTNITAISKKFSPFFKHYKKIGPTDEKDDVGYVDYKRTHKKMYALIPLQEHPIHGITGIEISEKYDDQGYVERYIYEWKKVLPRQGVSTSHISGWGNEPHNAPNTPEKYKVDTEPHHHHYDPNDRKNRRNSFQVRTVEDVFNFVIPYIQSGDEYTGFNKKDFC